MSRLKEALYEEEFIEKLQVAINPGVIKILKKCT